MSDIERITRLPDPPSRPDDGHKGTFGSVLIIAGSEGMSGAASLAGFGALHGGAGMVTLAVPSSICEIVATIEPSWRTIPLIDEHSSSLGMISKDSIAQIEVAIKSSEVVAVGPGLGRSPAVESIVQRLNNSCNLPLVIDADGLNAISGDVSKLARRETNAARVLTPHPGEFYRLTGFRADSNCNQQERESLAAKFAREHHLVLLLKGARTIITDGKRLAVNESGNSGMGTGGAGDVLTGLIAALIAQKMEPFFAAQLGAYLHGIAGDFAAEQLSPFYICASDIYRSLAPAWIHYLQRN